MVKFDASKFKTTTDPTPRQKFKYEVEDILRHVRNLKPNLRVGWIRERPHVLAIAPDRETVGCMTIMSTAPSYEEREPYGNIDVAVYDMSLQEVIDSWECNDGAAAVNAAYPGSIERGCKWLGWISEPNEEEEWDSYI